jgi:hypothetical protein
MGNSGHLFETIFNRNLSDGDIQKFLTETVKEYPYFTAAQFYLLLQTQPGSIEYENQAAKTSILFNNPFWLGYLLNQSENNASVKEENIINQQETNTVISINETPVIEKIPAETEAVNTDLENTNPADKIAENEVHDEISNERGIYNNTATEIVLQETENIIDSSEKNSFDLYEAGNDEKGEINFPENIPATALPAEEIYENTSDSSTPVALEQAFVNTGENYEGEQYKENIEGALYEDVEEKEIAPMNIKLDFAKEIATTEDTISFEPLHTSDYFASVGIKLSDDVKPGDKLGKQLKSFTDWLKTMKKIHPGQLPPQSDQSVITIQTMAEKSNTEAEVLTEAMAEVLLQQGKNAKAREVYKKLSLLNPSKSAYFAAKIDHIEN